MDAGLYRSDGAGASPDLESRVGSRERQEETLSRLLHHLRDQGKLWLFLDYDGTLVPIAQTPAHAQPDQELLQLLGHLVRAPSIRTCVISGRPLVALRAMLPIPGLFLAGLYGVEIKTPGNKIDQRIQGIDPRKTIDQIKRVWAQLIQGREGFLLEDKGLSVALHGRLADLRDFESIWPRARKALAGIPASHFRILGGDRFLEIAPAHANKGEGVEWLLDHYPLPDALPVYFGDDDKDEEAFDVILRHGGIPVMVGPREPAAHKVIRLASPGDVRMWLQTLL